MEEVRILLSFFDIIFWDEIMTIDCLGTGHLSKDYRKKLNKKAIK